MDRPCSLSNCVVLDPKRLEPRIGNNYPEAYRAESAGREKRALGKAAGLTNFGVNLTTLKPGTWSAQRHWHSKQDEFVYILEGEATLVTDDGETVLKAGMAVGFKAGVPNGHHLVNKSDRPVTYIEIGDRSEGDQVDYPDIDMMGRFMPFGRFKFFDRKGQPY